MNLNSAADFCPQCHSFIELPEISDKIECNRCGFVQSILDYVPKEIVTVQQMEPKAWLDLSGVEKERLHTRATIKQDCPKCSNDTMYFWTAQLRSADEGSTVFYECVECEYRYQQNN